MNPASSDRPRPPKTLASHWLPSLTGTVLILLSLGSLVRASRPRPKVQRGLPAASVPGPRDRVLIIAPHPDDETLGCGGVIQQSLQRGAEASVVVVTAGDAFSIIAHRLFPRQPFTPAVFRKLGVMRMAESRAALLKLGVSPSHIHFLGYPDTGIRKLWSTHWSKSRPLTARRTQAARSPYPTDNQPGSNYSGESLLKDLLSRLERDRPTFLYYPYPADANADHRTLSWFTQKALKRWEAEKGTLPTEETYLVHCRQRWPWPHLCREEQDLLPPASVMSLSHQKGWSAVELKPEEVEKKRTALLCYRSQYASRWEAGFFRAFVRHSEPFYTLHTHTAR